MARRRERQYPAPLIKPRAFWSEDEIRTDTLALAKLSQKTEPEPLAEVIVFAVAEGLEPEPYEPLPTATKRPHKVKPPAPPATLRVVFGPDGEMIGWLYTDTAKFDPARRGATQIYRKMKEENEQRKQDRHPES